MKVTLTNWLCALCAVLLIAVLAFQFKQQGRLDSLQRQQDSLASAASQQRQDELDAATKLAIQVASLGTNLESRLAQGEQQTKEESTAIANTLQQQTAVIHRALGKVIPVELPEPLIGKLSALEVRIGDTNSWPKDAAEADAMLVELRDLVRQIPPWAEEDSLPRLNAVRWGVQSLQVLQASANVDGEALATATETFANQISTQPDAGSANIATALAKRQADSTQQFAVYRRESAISNAKEQLGLAVTTDALAVWQRLGEWTNTPRVLELRQQLRSRLIEDDVARFADGTKVSVQRLNILTNVGLRQAGYFRAMENITVQRLRLLEEPDAPVNAVNALAELSVSVEEGIKAETEKQRQDDAERVRGYQQWALKRIKDFEEAFKAIENKEISERKELADKLHGKSVFSVAGSVSPLVWSCFYMGAEATAYAKIDLDYKAVAGAMQTFLLSISSGYLEPAVLHIYNEAFERGWKKLDGKVPKPLQTEIAKQEGFVTKKTPQNYQEQP